MAALDRTWLLFKESFTVLSGDAELLLFPALSGASAVLLAAGFFLPLYRDGTLEAIRLHKAAWDSYAVLFAWYYINFFVGIFFNAALIGCANLRLAGGQPSVRAGFRMAASRLGRIASWAFVAATVGLLLSSLRDRNNTLLRLVAGGLALAWSLITYLIVPVILFEDHSVFDAIYRSEELFKNHWGEQLAGSFGFGLVGLLLSLPAFALAAFCWRYDPIAGIILAAVYVLILSTVTSAVRGIFTAALYRYATAGTAPAGFSAHAIDAALGARPRAEWDRAPWDRAPWDRP